MSSTDEATASRESLYDILLSRFGGMMPRKAFDGALTPAEAWLQTAINDNPVVKRRVPYAEGEGDTPAIDWLLKNGYKFLVVACIGYEVSATRRDNQNIAFYSAERQEKWAQFVLSVASDVASDAVSAPPPVSSVMPETPASPDESALLDRLRRSTQEASAIVEELKRVGDSYLAEMQTELLRDKGDKGDKGDTGDTGPKGDTGDVGPQGDIGPVGPKGLTGDTGPKGDAGPVGPKGATGATGAKGDKGDTGPRGVIGLTGPKGDKGDTGATGPEVDLSLATIRAGQVSGFGDSWKKMVWKRVADLNKTEAGFRDKSLDNNLLGTILPLRINGSVIAGFGGSRNNVLHTRNAGLLLTNASFAERRIPIDISGISSLLFVIRNYIYVYASRRASAKILWDNKDEYDFYAFFANPMAFVPNTIDGKPTRYGYNATGVKGVGTEEGPLPPEQGS